MTLAALTYGQWRPVSRLVPDTPAGDRPPDGAENPEHRADDDQRHADIGQESRGKISQDRQDDSEHNHFTPFLRFVAAASQYWLGSGMLQFTFGFTPA